jgi:hypothetical protein
MKLAMPICPLVWTTAFGDGRFAPFSWTDLSDLLKEGSTG